MRKWIVFITALCLTACLGLTALAKTEGISIADAYGKPGEIVYVTVTLEDAVKADTVGISYSFDSKDLKALPDLCTWGKNGDLDGFDTKNNGAWAVTKPVELKGDLCTLAFRVEKEAKFKSTKISCQVQIENAETKATVKYEATGTVKLTQDHTHQYGKWESISTINHSRTCISCPDTQTQEHTFDSGKIVQQGGKQQKVYTCSVCGGTKAYNVEGGLGQVEPTEEETTKEPSKETTAQTPDKETTSKDPQTQTDGGYGEKPHPEIQIPTIQETGHAEHDHGVESTTPFEDYNQPETESTGERVPVESQTEQEQHADHDHTVQNRGSFKWETLVALVVVAAVIVAGAMIYIKKKK